MKELIQEQLWAFGFLPLLLVLEEMQDREEYEICDTILEVLREHGERFNIEIPTKYSPEAVIQMKLSFMTNFNLSGDITDNNKDWYASEIINKIDNFKIK